MTLEMGAGPRWSTSSYGAAADTSLREASALGEHLHLCRRTSGRLFTLRCRADAVHGFVASRFVTTLAVLGLLAGAAGLLL